MMFAATRVLSARRGGIVSGLLRLSSRVMFRRSLPSAVSSLRRRHFSGKAKDPKYDIPRNQWLSAKKKKLAKKFAGKPLTCYACEPPITFTTPKEFREHNRIKHRDAICFCGCKSGFDTWDLLHTHHEVHDCGYGPGGGGSSGGGGGSITSSGGSSSGGSPSA